MPATGELHDRIMSVVNSDWLFYLYDRWQDESEYEDWSDYEQAFVKNSGFKLVKSQSDEPMTFWFTIDDDSKQYEMQVLEDRALYR